MLINKGGGMKHGDFVDDMDYCRLGFFYAITT